MNSQIEHALATITVVMPIILVAAHVAVTISERLYEYALTTPGTGDDRVVLRILTVARWIDQVARAIAHVASMGVLARDRGIVGAQAERWMEITTGKPLNPTPASEAAGITTPERPSAMRGER